MSSLIGFTLVLVFCLRIRYDRMEKEGLSFAYI